MTLEDFALWQAYYAVEPWGEERADYRAATIAYTTWSVGMGLAGKRPPAHVKPEDFLVVPLEERRKHKITDPARMEELFQSLHRQMQDVKRDRTRQPSS